MGIGRIFSPATPEITPTPAPAPEEPGADPEEEERRRRRAAFAGIATTPLGVATSNQATGRSRLLGV